MIHIPDTVHSVTYLETRIPQSGYRIQVMPKHVADILPDKPEVHVKFLKLRAEGKHVTVQICKNWFKKSGVCGRLM